MPTFMPLAQLDTRGGTVPGNRELPGDDAATKWVVSSVLVRPSKHACMVPASGINFSLPLLLLSPERALPPTVLLSLLPLLPTRVADSTLVAVFVRPARTVTSRPASEQASGKWRLLAEVPLLTLAHPH